MLLLRDERERARPLVTCPVLLLLLLLLLRRRGVLLVVFVLFLGVRVDQVVSRRDARDKKSVDLYPKGLLVME